MAADSKPENSVQPDGGGRSRSAGDVPEHLRRRYYLDGRGGDLGFYVDAQVKAAAFRDHGDRLVSTRSDPNAIRDMAAIAKHRGWTVVNVQGAASFRREAWLTARSLGVEAQGYRPTDRDLQELERRTARERSRNQTPDSLKVVEAVVRARVGEPKERERILSAARERVEDLIAKGARFSRLDIPTGRTPIVENDRPRERHRTR